MAVVASKFSSVAGPAKWFAVGVVGTVGIGASIWAYASRSHVAATRPEKPSSALVTKATATSESNDVRTDETAFEPVMVARDVSDEETRSATAAPSASDESNSSVDASLRPMIVHRTKMGPGVFEALPVPVNALEGSSVGNGSLGIFPTRRDLVPMRAPQDDAKRDGVGPDVERDQADGEDSARKDGSARDRDGKNGDGQGDNTSRNDALKKDKAKRGTPDTKHPTRDAQPVARSGKLIDVNTATQAELELLPDIGPALAKRIIEYRTKHGAFTNLAALDKVSGIGSKTLEKLKDRVTFGKAK